MIQRSVAYSVVDRKRRTNGWTSQNAGVYPGLDRFGRVIRQAWLDGATGSTQNGYRPAIVDQTHAYDAASNRLSRLDGREGASWANRDWEFSYDGLNRLTEARQGVRAGQTWTPSSGSQQWVLDMLGNWASQRTDLSGNGLFTDALDRLDERSHNQANELSTRVLKKGDGSATTATLPLSYDAAGQMRQEQKAANQAWRYTHDAWGRLVKVETVNTSTQAVKPISTHRFNGLHWRIAKAWHAVPDAQDKPDRKTTFWYDAAWRVVQETQRDQVNEAGTLEETIFLQFWGARYIDDAVARLRLTGDGSGDPQSGSDEEIVFQLTDAQFSVIALATPGKPSVVIDRIAYTPYGEATRTLRSDVNGDGVVNKDDYNTIIQPLIGTSIGDPAYVVEADLDRDGKITQDDYDVCIADDGQKSGGGVGEAGLFSAGVRNSVGYCGYIYNEDTGLYTVRYRTYSAWLGRWLRRDPLGYMDGSNLYLAVGDSPVASADPLGLYDVSGHFWTVYLLLTHCRGIDPAKALELAYYTQLPDIWGILDAVPAGVRGNFPDRWRDPKLLERDRMLQEVLHSLHGGNRAAVCKRRACLQNIIKYAQDNEWPAWQIGALLHAYGDAFAHTNTKDGNGEAYSYPNGHGRHGHWPDIIGNRPELYRQYCFALCRTLGGTLANDDDIYGVPSGESEEDARKRLEELARKRHLPLPTFDPTLTKQFAHGRKPAPYPWPTQDEVVDFLRKLKGMLADCERRP